MLFKFNSEPSFDKFLEKLPLSTFFNFSSIVYDMDDKKFVVGKPFLQFLYHKKLDIVLEKNHPPALCIVNSFYYSDKYNLKMSKKLVKYIACNYIYCQNDFEIIQESHFGKILYSKTILLNRIQDLISKLT